MAVALKPILPPTRSGRTFLAAAVILGAVASLQLIILAWWYAHGNAAARRDELAAELATAGLRESVPPAEVVPTPVPAARLANMPSNLTAPAAPALAGGGLPVEPVQADDFTRPTPAPLQRIPGNPGSLLEYARGLRQRGDTNSALAKLRDALATEPNNPDLIAETALTYEAMQLPDKAFEQWQRVFDMGESVGALYYMADTKLHNAPGRPGAVGVGPTPTNGVGRDNNGFQDNAFFKITDVHVEDVLDDPNAEKKTTMRIVVKSKPGTAVDPSKVKIETYFYDLLDGKDVVLTDALTSYKWLTEPVDWANDASEILETTYTRPRSEPAPESPVAALAAPTPSPSNTPVPGKVRRVKHSPKMEAELAQALAASAPPEAEPAHVRIYLGYSVRVYYDRQLQDVQADPIRLLQQFPPPLTLPVDEQNPLLPAQTFSRRPL